MSEIRRLADFASELSLASVPERARHQALLCLLDTVGCTVAGSVTEEASRLTIAECSGSSSGRSTIFGRPERTNAKSAARINGYAGDIFEINDLIGGHASIGIVSAALAVAEDVGASGPDLVVALAAGIEVTARLYGCFYPHLKSYEDCGLVSVGVPSTVGSAAAVARLLGLSPEQTRQALAIAAALAGWCPAEVIFGQGGTMKPLLFGSWPAATAIQAAHYARAGLTGPPAILESRIGYFATIAKRYDPDALEPQEWALERPRRKLHACCGYIHSALDAVVRMRRNSGQGGSIKNVTVGLPAYILPAVVKDDLPASGNEARFHLQYCVALALAGADAITPEHSLEFPNHLRRREVVAYMKRIEVVADPSLSHYHQAVVGIVQRDGTTITERNEAPKGSPGNPMSDDEVVAKFSALVEPVLGHSAAAEIHAVVVGLENTSTLDRLSRALSKSTSGTRQSPREDSEPNRLRA